MNHRPGARLSAGSLTVLPTVRFSSATTVVFTTAANRRYSRCGGSNRDQRHRCDHRELIAKRYKYAPPGIRDQPWLLFRRARFVNGPPVPAGGTVKDQRVRQFVLYEGHRSLARGADEAGVFRWCQWYGGNHTAIRGKAGTTTEDAVLAETEHRPHWKAHTGQTKVGPEERCLNTLAAACGILSTQHASTCRHPGAGLPGF